MQKIRFLILAFLPLCCFSQPNSGKWLRAFPVTNYKVDLNDSTTVVQLQLPTGIPIADRQLGLLRGTYRTAATDTMQKGYGRCYLIKGDYYYFAIGHRPGNAVTHEGDLLYTFMDTTAIYYGRLPKLAGHFIELQDVYDKKFFDRYDIFSRWNEADEKELIDSMVTDIQFTGNYFMQHDASADKVITEGSYKGKKILGVMAGCRPAMVNDFLDYIIARPRLYAGGKWKLSEIFATWLAEGAPAVIKQS